MSGVGVTLANGWKKRKHWIGLQDKKNFLTFWKKIDPRMVTSIVLYL
jgi:hypothetical protein